jgi:hypothetical protein
MTAEVSVELLVLHQGRNAAVVKRDGGHFNAGSPVTDYLIKVYDRLALVTGAHSPASGADL